MRTVFLFLGGLGTGHLIAKGLLDSNADEWITALVIGVCFIGYIVVSGKEFIKTMKKLLPLLLLFISCSKEHSTINKIAREDSVSMSLVVDENLAAIPSPNGIGCGAGAYRSILYNQAINMYFSFNFGFDGTNCTYGNLDSYGSTSAFWIQDNKSWNSNYMGGSVSGLVMPISASPQTLGYRFNWNFTPQTCMLHWTWVAQP